MTISYLDNTQVTTTTTGTGTLTQGSAVTGFRAPEAGDDGKTYTVMIKGVDGSGVPTGEFELTESIYTHSGTTWSRGTLLDSSTGSRINFAAGTKRISVAQASRDIIRASGQSVLGSSYTITTNATYEDTGLSVTLPVAGTYIVAANIRASVQASGGTAPYYIVSRLYDSTNAAYIADSERLVKLTSSTGQEQGQSAFNFIITCASSVVIKLYAKRDAGATPTWVGAQVFSDSAGYTTMNFNKVG